MHVTELGLNPSPLMAVDILDDAELGFGKDTVLHLICLLYVLGGGAVQTFDAW